jgi:putative holliday junction resolvase
MQQATNGTILALDIGERRIGVARASTVARLASPLATLDNNEQFINNLRSLIDQEQASLIVVGLPRNLSGEDTAQTELVRQFTIELEQSLNLKTVFQDEALTSHKAEQELNSRGRSFTKGDVDALAATYILEDYLRNNSGETS